MLLQSTVCLTLAAAVDASFIPSLASRQVAQGWSLQASICPAGAKSCDSAACCPSSLSCTATGNGEVLACCPPGTNCRGAVEGNPSCADSSWSLWKGQYGNGFCCEVGLVGAYRAGGSNAGSCAASVAAGQTSAVLMTRGTGPTATPTTRTSSTSPTSTTSATSTRSTTRTPAPTGKPVYAHYMIGGINDAHCQDDVVAAQGLSIDAFALNYNQFADWSNRTVDQLFNHADRLGFKLFFSFDMAPGYFTDPSQFRGYLEQYIKRPSYYYYQGKALVSTFAGENVPDSAWQQLKTDVRAHTNVDITIIPGFYQATATQDFFNGRRSLDGVFNWNSWPTVGQGKVAVSTRDDALFQTAAKATGKLFMMGLSPLQFKHSRDWGNWYRRGEQNLENRLLQVLDLQPDMLEIQTWNDAGESHYMGYSWDEPIEGAPELLAYTKGYDHTGYWEILHPFIRAWKAGYTTGSRIFPTNGLAAQGSFWHHTLLANGDCSQDSIGKPEGQGNIEDNVTGAIVVAEQETGLTVVAYSGGRELGRAPLVPGYNAFSFPSMIAGAVRVEVIKGAQKILSGSGPKQVLQTSDLCNYNYQVVGLTAS